MHPVEAVIWSAVIIVIAAIALEIIFRKQSKRNKDIEMWHERNKRNRYEDKCQTKRTTIRE